MVSKSETTPPEKKPVSCEDHQRERWRRQRKNVCKRKGKVVPFRRAATTPRYSWMPQRASHNSLRKLLLSFAVGFVLTVFWYWYAYTYIYIDTQIPIATHRICTYVRVVTHRGPDSWYTHVHIHIHTHTHSQAWYYCERACSKQFPICLPLSILSVPSSFRSLLSWATSSVSILSPRPNPLNASAGAHVHPNRLYLHLIASSKVLLRHV